MKAFIAKHLVALVVSACVLVGGGVAAGVAINNNQPENVAKDAVLGVIKDFTEREEINPIYNMVQGGSLEASLGEVTFVEGEERNTVKTPVSGKMYFGKKALMLENFSADIEGVKIAGDVYISNDLVYVNEEEFLGGAYGFTLEDAIDDIEDSILNPDSGSKYAIDREMYDAMIALLEEIQEVDNEEFKKDVEKIGKKYMDKLWKAVCKHAEFESETDKVKLNGDKTSVRVVTITIDNDAVAGIVETMYEFLEDDDSIEKFLEKYEDYFDVAFDYFVAIGLPVSEGDILDMYEDAIDEIGDNIDDIVESIEDGSEFEVVVSMATPKLSSKLLKLEVEAEFSGYDQKIVTIDFGPKGLKKTNMVTVEVAGMEVVYEIETNDSKKYEACLEVMDEEVLTIAIDKSKDKFNVRVNLDETSYIEANGSFVEKGSTVTIGLDEIKSCYESFALNPDTGAYDIPTTDETVTYTDLEVIIKEKDKMPSAPKDYTTIADIKEADIDAIMSKFNTLYGTYENEGLFGVGATEITFEEGNSIAIETMGLHATGIYEIDGDMITIELDDSNDDDTTFEDVMQAFNGTFTFEKGADYIKINGTKYTKAN
ncbi:MAG: hypothetical protein IJX27_02920 [Clostridia bacterium]|nr:hypothetical protein [Clostridia bacterium]